MKVLLCTLLVGCVLLQGCGGREAHPVAIYQPGDDNRSCTSLKGEIAQTRAEIERLKPKSSKGAWNTGMATAGVFLIVPFFAMDFKNADKVELNALVNRYNYLQQLAAEKGCYADPNEVLSSK